MARALAVGVDAGGSSTVVAFSRAGRYAGGVAGGPANPSSMGSARAAQTIAKIVRDACGAEDPAAMWVGAAGAASRSASQALQAALSAAFPETSHLTVSSDVATALRAALPHGPGIVVVAGTGSVAYGENGEQSARAGGDGYLLGDEGSGFAIGFEAVKLLARAFDGRTAFDETAALVQDEFAVADRDGLLAAIYSGPLDVARIAALAPKVIGLAAEGNAASMALVASAAASLSQLVTLVAVQIGVGSPMPVVFAGGLLREDNLLSAMLRKRLAQEVPLARPLRLEDEPARAALRFAEAMLG